MRVKEASNRVMALLTEQGVNGDFDDYEERARDHTRAAFVFCQEYGIDIIELNTYVSLMAQRWDEGIEAGVDPVQIMKGALMSSFFCGVVYGRE